MSNYLSELAKRGRTAFTHPVELTGREDKIPVHAFSMNQMDEVMKRKECGNEFVLTVSEQLIKFLNGFDYEIQPGDIRLLGDLFCSWEVRELYDKALKLNGFGPGALREAEKN